MPLHDLAQLVSSFRVKYGDRPFWLFVAALAALTLIGIAAGRLRRGGGEPGRPASRVPVWLGLAAIATYVAIVLWYFQLPIFFDHAEPTVAAIAWLFNLGQPVYHAPDAAERYAHIYGPFAVMIPAWFLAALGPGMAQAKASGIAAGLLSLALVYRLVRRPTSARTAVILTGLFAVQALIFRNLAFWIRPDSFQMLFVAAGLLGATSTRPWIASLALGISTGVLMSLKFTGFLYALPAVGLLAAAHGVRWIVPCALAAAAMAVWPFVVFDNVSFAYFRHWVGLSADNGVGFVTLRQNVEWGAFILLPVVPTILADLVSPADRRRRTCMMAGLVAGIVGVIVAASKPGAGPYHVMPFLPVVFYALALHLPAIPDRVRQQPAFRHGGPALALVSAILAICQQVFFFAGIAETAGMRFVDDLRQFAAAHPDETIAMGYGKTGERLTFSRAILVFQNGEYLLDAPAIQEYQMSGEELPPQTIAALGACRVDLFVFPKGSDPFTAANKYPSVRDRPLFSPEFRRVFFERYERAPDTEYFQVWRCRGGPR